MMGSNYEYVNSPAHYISDDGKECIDLMIDKFGVNAVITFCQLNAYKYLFRAGKKPGNSAEQDVKKAEWYTQKAEELKGNVNGTKMKLNEFTDIFTRRVLEQLELKR